MSVTRFNLNAFLIPGTEGMCCPIVNQTQMGCIHNHDYYEIFLVYEGTAVHLVNNCKQALSPDTLVFVRPDDVHGYIDMSPEFKFLNLLIAPSLINDIKNFLGAGFDFERLISCKMSPIVHIPISSRSRMISKFRQLNMIPNVNFEKMNTLLRTILIEVFTSCFPAPYLEGIRDVPTWLEWLTLEMQKQEYYEVGLPALYKLTGKSPEYICRVFKKHLGKTPTEFINEIRIHNAKLLLIGTDKSIVEICNSVGFENLSHFYHVFQKNCGMSPGEFKKRAVCIESSI